MVCLTHVGYTTKFPLGIYSDKVQRPPRSKVKVISSHHLYVSSLPLNLAAVVSFVVRTELPSHILYIGILFCKEAQCLYSVCNCKWSFSDCWARVSCWRVAGYKQWSVRPLPYWPVQSIVGIDEELPPDNWLALSPWRCRGNTSTYWCWHCLCWWQWWFVSVYSLLTCHFSHHTAHWCVHCPQ